MGVEYRRQLGTLDAAMVVVGAIIGGGIYRNPPLVAQNAGAVGLALGLWVVGGIITIAGGFCFAELGARMPQAGGSYVYLREGHGRLVAFLQGWALVLVNGAGAIAAVAALCSMMFVAGSGAPAALQTPFALSAIAVLTVVNCLGVRPGATTQNVLTFLKISTLVVLAGVGLFGSPAAAPSPAGAAAAPGFSAIGAALIAVIFSYNGWQVVGFLAGEIDDAPRRLPLAILGGILGTMAIYLVVNVALFKSLGLAGLAASKAPATAVMERAFGSLGGTIMTWGVVISTLGFLNVAILTVPRAVQTMARDGLFFESFAELHPRWRTPVMSIVLQSVWACVLLLSGSYESLLAWVGFADALFLGLAAAALIRIRSRETPEAAAAVPFRAPLYPLLPLFYILASAVLLVSSVAADPGAAPRGAGLILLGVPVYFYWERGAVR